MSQKEREPNPELFYLGFNKDTGKLEHVIPPQNHELNLDPAEHKKYENKELSDKKRLDFEKRKKHLEQLIDRSRNKFEIQPLAFADNPGNSVCGGSVGGIPFSWCP